MSHEQRGNQPTLPQESAMFQRALERSLWESELRLRAVVSNAPLILFALDRRGCFTLSEGRGLHTLGRTPGQVVGRSITEIYADQPAILERVQRALAGEACEAVVEMGGRTFDAWYVPVRGDDGSVTGAIGVAIDNTARYEANAQLTAQVAALQARTRAMTLLNELGERLQNVDVAAGGVVAIAARYLPQLFPDHAGVLYLLGPGDAAEPVAAWGDLRAMGGDGGHRIQLQVQGEALGWLALSPDPGAAVEEAEAALWLRDARAAAHQIALALANLRLRETLRRQASHDDLTGLLNRRALIAALEGQLARAAGAPLCVVLGDIDHFKRINDSRGHGAGDAVIRLVADLMREAAGQDGLACRYGGEELVMVLPGAGLAAGLARAESLRAAVAALAAEHEGAPLSPITISLGVAAFPHHGTSVEDLLRAADRALYAGKWGGRNRVVAAGDEAAPAGR
jgi:diguanylate cyclase (GGDEF)-like protein/PAS domain S-box-containing protein